MLPIPLLEEERSKSNTNSVYIGRKIAEE
jgi:hypothetical protein